MKSTLCQLAAAFALLSSSEAGLPQYEVINLTSWFASDSATYPNDIQAIGLTDKGEVLTTRSLRTDQGLRLWKNGSPVTSGYVPVLPGYDTPFSGNFVSRYGVGSNGLKAIDVTKADPSDPNNYLKAEYHVVIADTRGLTIQTVPDLPVGNADFSFPNQSPNAKFLTASSNDDTRTWRFDTVTSQWSEIVTGGRWITSNAVNDHGTVVGEIAVPGGSYKPFVYSDGAGLVEIMDGVNNLSGEAVAINSSGLVTGTANGRAFVFNSATLEFEFITPAVGLVAADINDAGAIIGATQLGGSIFGIPNDSAFYWDAENGLTGIDNLIGDSVNDWFITDATDINEDGWILATGFDRINRTSHQVLLRPVPEPGVAALLMLGSFGIMTRRRRVQRIFINGRSGLALACVAASAVFGAGFHAEAASVWVSIEGTIESVRRYPSDAPFGGVPVEFGSIVSGTNWTLQALIGETSDEDQPYGIIGYGSLFIGGDVHLVFDSGSAFHYGPAAGPEGFWILDVENEISDNPRLLNAPSGNEFNQLTYSLSSPNWTNYQPPVGTQLLGIGNAGRLELFFNTSPLNIGVFGTTTRFIVVPEPSASFLVGVSGLWLIKRRRKTVGVNPHLPS